MSDATGSSAFRFIDLFAGIGGLRIGFDAIGGKCLFTSEWNPYAQKTYRANFHDDLGHLTAGDITKIEACTIPEPDVRCEIQGTLSLTLLENVENLVNHDKESTFRIIHHNMEISCSVY